MNDLIFYLCAMTGAVLGALIGYAVYKAVPKKEPKIKTIEKWRKQKVLKKNFDRQIGCAIVIGLIIFSIIYMSDGSFAQRVDYFFCQWRADRAAQIPMTITVNDGIFIFFAAMLEFVIFGIWISRERRMKKLVEAYRP